MAESQVFRRPALPLAPRGYYILNIF